MDLISKEAKIGSNIKIGNNTIIGSNVIIGDNVVIGNNVVVNNCKLADNVKIEDNCTIGYGNATGWFSRPTPESELVFNPLVIGSGSLIREGATIYVGGVLGENVRINHKVVIRENSKIGDFTSIGTMCDLEGNLTVGRYCSINSNVHLCSDTFIGDYVFMAPFTVTTNGNPMMYRRPQLYEKFGYEKGPVIESGCQIAVHVVILPRVRIGYESIIGAKTLVTKDVEPLSVVIGSPGVKRGVVEELHRLPLEIRKELGLA
jgi:UDP-2-acetamido-3-amino-2,3-dideoxy-glucuronate N-acetyltransferase